MKLKGNENILSISDLFVWLFMCILSICYFSDLVYVLATMLIILIWCFSINWSKLQEAAKRCDVHGDHI